MKKQIVRVALMGVLTGMVGLSAGTASAGWGNNNHGPYGYNDWPEWTPMYWMEEMSNEFDNNGWGNNRGYYGPDGYYYDYNDWPEWTPMYWMQEMANEFDNNGWGNNWNNNWNNPNRAYGPPPVYGQPPMYGPRPYNYPPAYTPYGSGPGFQAPPMAPNQIPQPLPPKQGQAAQAPNAPPMMTPPPGLSLIHI